MKKCIECGYNNGLDSSSHEAELPCGVMVEEKRETCPECNEVYTGYDRPEALFREVAKMLARASYRLGPSEIKWLRKYIGYSQAAWGEYLAISRETVNRWESPNSHESIPVGTERLLRILALSEPQVEDYGTPSTFKERDLQNKPTFKTNSLGDWVRA